MLQGFGGFGGDEVDMFTAALQQLQDTNKKVCAGGASNCMRSIQESFIAG